MRAECVVLCLTYTSYYLRLLARHMQLHQANDVTHNTAWECQRDANYYYFFFKSAFAGYDSMILNASGYHESMLTPP